MPTIKELFSKILSGFLLGIGFGAAVFLIAVIMEEQYFNFSEENKEKYVDFEEGVFLEITDHSIAQRSADRLEIIGNINNKSSVRWSGPTIEVELFDTNNKFVYECSDRLVMNLKPSTSENFLFRCGGCGTELPEFASYQIKISTAFGFTSL